MAGVEISICSVWNNDVYFNGADFPSVHVFNGYGLHTT